MKSRRIILGNLGISWGFDGSRAQDFHLYIALMKSGWKTNTKAAHTPKRWFWFETGWNWLPSIYRHMQPSGSVPYWKATHHSRDWTGRTTDYLGWSWPFFLDFGFRLPGGELNLHTQTGSSC